MNKDHICLLEQRSQTHSTKVRIKVISGDVCNWDAVNLWESPRSFLLCQVSKTIMLSHGFIHIQPFPQGPPAKFQENSPKTFPLQNHWVSASLWEKHRCSPRETARMGTVPAEMAPYESLWGGRGRPPAPCAGVSIGLETGPDAYRVQSHIRLLQPCIRTGVTVFPKQKNRKKL